MLSLVSTATWMGDPLGDKIRQIAIYLGAIPYVLVLMG